MVWTKAFWKGLAERAIKSAAQGFIYGAGLSVLVAEVGDGAGVALVDVPWMLGLQTAFVLAVLSAVTSVGNAQFTAGHETIPAAPIVQVVGGAVTTEGSSGPHLTAFVADTEPVFEDVSDPDGPLPEIVVDDDGRGHPTA